MKHDFNDITSRISEPPAWWDKNGTPRYGEFNPDAGPDIYADREVLLWITCQSCGRRFNVEMSSSSLGRIRHKAMLRGVSNENPAVEFVPLALHYGDPPAHGCVGDTMNCWDIAVLESWSKKDFGEWERSADDEGPMADWGETDH